MTTALYEPAAVATAVIERYGPYVCWFDADTTDVEVFTEGGSSTTPPKTCEMLVQRDVPT
ncbi:hypothetical protein ACIQ9I_36180 [Streptomyces sp. NPDC094461]|uniref:hypothetical protein n=1 Tax=Streptomyces sp. NPDC094461 TaxID=3366064 RepID=UPI00381F0599